jgi:hypothetical protein
MNKINSYSSPFNVGHKALENLFTGTVIVQEKVDGSQFSFGVDDSGKWFARSKRVQLHEQDKYGMFDGAVATVVEIAELLTPGYTYRGEYLQKPKHNTLAYSRVPNGGIIVFDIDKGDQDYMMPEELIAECERIGLEHVPYLGQFDSKPKLDELKVLLDTDSVLGGHKIEGVVLKNYAQFGVDKKTLMEKHSKDWKQRNPSRNDVILAIIEDYATEPRWRKAVNHLREEGKIELAPQDIPSLMKEINQDVLSDSEDEIRERLFKHFWKDISRGLTRGFPEWYKNYLVEEALDE